MSKFRQFSTLQSDINFGTLKVGTSRMYVNISIIHILVHCNLFSSPMLPFLNTHKKEYNEHVKTKISQGCALANSDNVAEQCCTYNTSYSSLQFKIEIFHKANDFPLMSIQQKHNIM